MENISQTMTRTTKTFSKAIIDSSKALTTILILLLWLIIRRGLRVLRTRKTLMISRSLVTMTVSIREIKTITKSSLFQ